MTCIISSIFFRFVNESSRWKKLKTKEGRMKNNGDSYWNWNSIDCWIMLMRWNSIISKITLNYGKNTKKYARRCYLSVKSFMLFPRWKRKDIVKYWLQFHLHSWNKIIYTLPWIFCRFHRRFRIKWRKTNHSWKIKS